MASTMDASQKIDIYAARLSDPKIGMLHFGCTEGGIELTVVW
jgi:hypothetical protein